jgi:hypothetical protein
MADPFSVTTGLCSIISLAEGVFKQGCQFLRASKHCPRELKALVLEVNSLKGTLEALETLVHDAVDSHLCKIALANFLTDLRFEAKLADLEITRCHG